MTNEEILEAAKEAGMAVSTGGNAYWDSKADLEHFAAIIERRTIERCAIAANKAWFEEPCYIYTITDAIRKLGEQ